ncbi:MAG: hypothetical protein ACE15C_17215 [Phycisphaerae bacterium]
MGWTKWIRRARVEPLLFGMMVCLELAPLWSCKCFPSQDGPSHLENSKILLDYHRQDRPLLREYYDLNTEVPTNWLGHLITAGLLAVLSPTTAEKVFVSGYLILFPLAVRYAAKGVKPDAAWASWFAFPFLYSHWLHMGFYNFSYGFAFFFLLVGYYLRHRLAFGVRQWAVASALGLVLFAWHPVSLVLAGLTVGISGAGLAYAEWARDRGRSGWSRGLWPSIKSVSPALSAFAPAALLLMLFVRTTQEQDPGTPETLSMRLGKLILVKLPSFHNAEVWLLLALSAGLIGLSAFAAGKAVRQKKLDGGVCFLAVAAICAAMVLVLPRRMAGGDYFVARVAFFVYFALILWLAGRDLALPLRRCAQATAAGIAIVLAVLYASTYRQLDPYLDEFLSVSAHVKRDSTVLPICFARSGGHVEPRLRRTIETFLHAVGHVAIARNAIVLDNFEAASRAFPILYSRKMDPRAHIGTAELGFRHGAGPKLDILGYKKRTGGEVDYVLLWGLETAEKDNPAVRAVLDQLREGYEMVYKSSPHGLAQLYQRKPMR